MEHCCWSLWHVALGICWVGLVTARAPEMRPKVIPESFDGSGSSQLNPMNATEAKHLDIGDCHYASTDQNGLACKKEGYFINSFSRSVWWDPGQMSSWQWVRVPASSALCCRPNAPEDISTGTDDTAKPVGIISVGCHTSSNEGNRLMQCEATSSSFVAGFLDSLSLSKSPDTHYPIDGIECCTPVILMSNGDAWSIERCGCTLETNQISCQPPTSGSLLWGFEYTGQTGTHEIPLAPAMCCNLCVGSQLHSLSDCEDLHRCSGNGVCMMGSCQCKPGFEGADCSKEYQPMDGKEPWYKSFWWLGIICFLVAFGGLFMTFWMNNFPDMGQRDRRRDSGEAHDHLLDPEGSAGSIDTHSDQSITSVGLDSMHEVRGERTTVYHTVREGTPLLGDESHTGVWNVDTTAERRHQGASESPADGGDSSSRSIRQEDAENANGAGDDVSVDTSDEAYQQAIDEEGQAPPDSDDIAVVGKAVQNEGTAKVADNEATPLAGICCSVCFERPVQVALVPCGHSNLCRKCSRKLKQCPFCRREIVRRQKLYLVG